MGSQLQVPRRCQDSASDVLHGYGDDQEDRDGAKSTEGTVLEVKITQEVIDDAEPEPSASELDLKGDVDGALRV